MKAYWVSISPIKKWWTDKSSKYTQTVNTIELITSQNRNANDNNMYFNFAFYSADEYQYTATENKKYNVPHINQNDLYADLVGFPMTAAK